MASASARCIRQHRTCGGNAGNPPPIMPHLNQRERMAAQKDREGNAPEIKCGCQREAERQRETTITHVFPCPRFSSGYTWIPSHSSNDSVRRDSRAPSCRRFPISRNSSTVNLPRPVSFRAHTCDAEYYRYLSVGYIGISFVRAVCCAPVVGIEDVGNSRIRGKLSDV